MLKVGQRKGKTGNERVRIIYVWVMCVCVWMSALSDLLSVFRSRSLDEPLDLSLLRFGDTLEEGGVALHPKQDPLHHPSTSKT